MNILLLIAGFFFLIKGADVLVGGAASVARRLGVRTLVIGLTVVAFGTSAPELVVNLFSASSGASEIAIGNIFGSNIANILLILGVTAVLIPVKVSHGTIWKEIPLSLLAAVVVVIMGSDLLLDGIAPNQLSRTDGLVLLAFFLIFLVYTFGMGKVSGEQVRGIEVHSTWKSAGMIIGGILGLVLGGKFIVDAAVDIARAFSLSEHLIGATVVALGTSLPELATSIVAARKGQVDLAVGNVIGSNVFNLLFVLGATATVAPLAYGEAAFQDGIVVVFASTMLFFSMFIGGDRKLDRKEGAVLLMMYAGYIVWTVLRG